MTAHEIQPLIPFQPSFRIFMPFILGITLGICCAVTLTACQKQIRIIEDHSPIPLPPLVPPITQIAPNADAVLTGETGDIQAPPSESIESQMNKAIQVPATPETVKMKAALEGSETSVPASGSAPAKPKPKKSIPEEATLRVPKQ